LAAARDRAIAAQAAQAAARIASMSPSDVLTLRYQSPAPIGELGRAARF
jgi:hypothetical protein